MLFYFSTDYFNNIVVLCNYSSSIFTGVISTGNSGAAISTGGAGAGAISTGNSGAAISTGNSGAISTGGAGAAISTGGSGAISTGDSGASAGNSGAAISTSGSGAGGSGAGGSGAGAISTGGSGAITGDSGAGGSGAIGPDIAPSFGTSQYSFGSLGLYHNPESVGSNTPQSQCSRTNPRTAPDTPDMFFSSSGLSPAVYRAGMILILLLCNFII